jgi:hypothetical protein
MRILNWSRLRLGFTVCGRRDGRTRVAIKFTANKRVDSK